MINHKVKCANFEISNNSNFILIAGPCVIENEEITFSIARKLQELTTKLGITFVFKASFDKANRSSIDSFRGVGLKKGLEILQAIKNELSLKILTDVHTNSDVDNAAGIVDIIQIPAFLCRQTDLISHAARNAKILNIKKGQFLSPNEMLLVVDKVKTVNPNIKLMITERGTTFGYNNLVVDMRSLEILKKSNCPVIFDATHSVQLPGAGNGVSLGQRHFVPSLSRAAIAVGISGVFMETHPNPEEALSDGPNSVYLDKIEGILSDILSIDKVVKNF